MPDALATSLAAEKLDAFRALHAPCEQTILCFDTIVALEDQVLGKPADTADAWRMLRSLSGRTHEVVTGCAIGWPDGSTETFSVTTQVEMLELADDDIERWMAHGTYLGCAGAYNIEAQVARVTEDHCFQNVAGLPLCHVYARLADRASAADSDVVWMHPDLTAPVEACDSALCRGCRLGPLVVEGR